MATPMANHGTDMLTNPTVVRLHANMYGFYNNHCKPWHIFRDSALRLGSTELSGYWGKQRDTT